VVDNNVTTTYSPNSIDQYTSVTGNSITNGPEHEISAFNGVTYSYMRDEHLNSVTSGSTTYSMAYDALGRCVKRSLTGGPTTYYIYDGEKPILEYDANGTSVGLNVCGKRIDEILERVAIGSGGNWYTYFPQQDHEDSVTLLTDSSGNVIERYRYDAFGAPIIYTPTWTTRSATIYDNRFLFTGREYAVTYRSIYTTPTFNFYEYRARAYNPQLGRFMSEDPKLFDAGDYNLFRYCHNDPIDFTDPMGLDDQVWAQTQERLAAYTEAKNQVDITIAERISLWQKSMEGSIGGEQASAILQSLGQNRRLEMANPEASQLRPIDFAHPRTTKEFILAGNIVEHGNTMDTTPAIDPIDLLSGGIAGLVRSSVRSVAAKATATRAMWVGRDGELAARASGAQVLRPSKAAVTAAEAGEWSLMRAESSAWAEGARGQVPVFFGTGKGRIFLNDELPKLLNNMNSGKVNVIDITY
jgi:RHS repeat-associated protein